MTEKEARKRANAVLRRLAELRLAKCLSKRKLAEKAGLDPKTITLLERNQRMPAITTLLRISDALSINLSEILSEVEDESIESRENP